MVIFGFLALFVILLPCGGSLADSRLTIFDLPLGTAAGALPPAASFKGLACGSNGGPPLARLYDWTAFRRCAPEKDGVHEVYFEYDDSAEQAARARGDFPAGWMAGTAYEAFPIVASALFDDRGMLVGLRIVTDPRPEQQDDPFLRLRPRQEHYLLAIYLADRFGISPADCVDYPLEAGESAVFGLVTKRSCERRDAATETTYRTEARYLRRRGETDFDPDTGLRTIGQYVSETRAEIRHAAPSE
jgi:hypothetical protein